MWVTLWNGIRWGKAALDKASSENKPILLSIGYSACHWCHVMAHESFEDPETAKVMNEFFVNIKVDREERPDLDKIYQLLQFAIELTEVLLANFYDERHGGFYFTANDHETLIQRPKTQSGDSIPAGNGVAAAALNLLGSLTGAIRYLEAAEETLQAGAQVMHQSPASHASLLLALPQQLHPLRLVILRGDSSSAQKWIDTTLSSDWLNTHFFSIPPDASNLPDALKAKTKFGGVSAYICESRTCSPVITSQEDFHSALADG